MSRFRLPLLAYLCLTQLVGCAWPWQHHMPDGRHRSDIVDAVFKRRHNDHHSEAHFDPVMALARDLTVIEDDLRRDGTITVKKPDVWGDGNLVHSLQEFDAQLAQRTTEFAPTIQAYVARSDQAEFESSTALASSLAGPNAEKPVPAPPPAAANTNSTVIATTGTPVAAIEAKPLDIAAIPLFDLIAKSRTAAPATVQSIGVEPTELARQHATFVDVCQALRRRHMGDDNSRAAGYGLYKFRIPVSVLPGRETNHGHAAVVTLRAQLSVDEANLRYTFPKLVVADLVDKISPILLRDWDKDDPRTTARDSVMDSLNAGTPANLTYTDALKVYGEEIVALRSIAKANLTFEPGVPAKPAAQELRAFLFQYLGQVQSVLIRNNALMESAEAIQEAGDAAARGQYAAVIQARRKWKEQIACKNLDKSLQDVSWLVAVQAGILNENLHRMLDELRIRGKLPAEDGAFVRSPEIQFFAIPGIEGEPVPPETVRLWETIVREGFPLSVFTLDSQVEEQNVYDAFSRRREMQVALAYSVARGRFNTAQKLAFSRQLALDQAAIGLNRTVVGFSHGEDTFGWYFYPRVQSPPTESTNIGAFARTIWSTGPTEHYDRKHRELEPGIRECEVLVAMPSFVTEVSFDVTTNWESLACPGVTKRSYEEMVAQGGRIHRLQRCLGEIRNAQCYRPGDVARMFSRVEQLEKMLGLQTYVVNVPYEYEQNGTDLFDTGDAHLQPVLTGYYGLEFLQADDKGSAPAAFVFLTGRNFHPTLTHVIVGGAESHSLSDLPAKPDVEVINRQLLRVKVAGLVKGLSRKESFQVRAGTPAGMSNPLLISSFSPPPPPPAAKGWLFSDPSAPGSSYHLQAKLWDECCKEPKPFDFISAPAEFVIINNAGEPLQQKLPGKFLVQLTAKKKDGSALTFRGKPSPPTMIDADLKNDRPGQWTVASEALRKLIEESLSAARPDMANEAFTLQVTGVLAFDKYPLTKTINAIEIEVQPCECRPPGVTAHATPSNAAEPAHAIPGTTPGAPGVSEQTPLQERNGVPPPPPGAIPGGENTPLQAPLQPMPNKAQGPAGDNTSLFFELLPPRR